MFYIHIQPLANPYSAMYVLKQTFILLLSNYHMIHIMFIL